ncbi:DUF4419 domain-containing protein [uncultured Microscilla sp.]|uniref:DUF4419 domain-containing protein n=1 Tax=uncultured Microscilla sp. TaxID=432653 RepID=UPI002628178D|nr:DUF4419 domain-containing protein [uncultured Microscilla sp.]
MIIHEETIINGRKVKSITFDIETLESPSELLTEKPLQVVIKQFVEKVEHHNQVDYNIVPMGYHSLLYGMYKAYSDHRPFVLSPDIVWLTICQGFSNHVNINAQQQNDIFPYLKKKQRLTVTNNEVILGRTSSTWEDIPQQFINQLTSYIDQGLLDTLKADFSTTTSTERIVSEITILDTVKAYFEYGVAYMICGIPTITLEGEPSDWYKILDKLAYLKKFGLEWWVNKLNMIIKEFVATSKGQVDRDFWIDMFKVHTKEEYGSPKSIDGWITNFYPYDKKGNKIDLKKAEGITIEDIIDLLPKELVCVDFEYLIKVKENEVIQQIPMELWAGFVGLKQNKETYALKPEIGWFVSYQDNSKIRDESKVDKQTEIGTYSNLTCFPEELLNDKRKWRELNLNFQSEVKLPLNFPEIDVETLRVYGKVNENDKKIIETLQIKLYYEKEISLIVNGVFPFDLDGFFEFLA